MAIAIFRISPDIGLVPSQGGCGAARLLDCKPERARDNVIIANFRSTTRGSAMAFDVAGAKSYIQSIDLRGTPRSALSMDAATEAGSVFDKAKDQAQVVGSGLFSFEQGVDPEVREAISDSALLAQLHANKQVDFEKDPERWFVVYSEVLQNVGWTVQDQGWTNYNAGGTQAEVNEKVVDLLGVALGGSATALAVIKATIDALKGMAPDSPWITIFSREVQKANIARFQVGLVSTDPNGDVFVSLVACIIRAQNEITQVLLFKLKSANATFRANTMKASINRPSLTDLGPAIRSKTRAYQADYLSSIKDV
ncbi:MAG: hypothetical protein ACJ798_08105 [Phenylobacterium sp.]